MIEKYSDKLVVSVWIVSYPRNNKILAYDTIEDFIKDLNKELEKSKYCEANISIPGQTIYFYFENSDESKSIVLDSVYRDKFFYLLEKYVKSQKKYTIID